MEFSVRLEQCAKSVFYSNDSDNNPTRLERELSLDSNNVFSRSLIVEVDDGEVEVPVIARRYFESLVSQKIDYPLLVGTKRIVLPLYDNAPSQIRRTFDSIIAQIFTNVGFSRRLQKITTSKGEVYHGGKGIIFDEDYTPLLLCTIAARKEHTKEGNDKMTYYRLICHVSPKVFLEPDKMINKGIIKKLIPCYTSREVNFPSFNFGVNPESKKVKVVVDNFDKFFIEPIKPTPSATTNDALNKCLIDNMDDIMMLI